MSRLILKADSKKAAHGFAVAFDRVRFRDLKKLQHQPFERTVNFGDRQRIPALFRTEGRVRLDDLIDRKILVLGLLNASCKKKRSESLSASRLSTMVRLPLSERNVAVVSSMSLSTISSPAMTNFRIPLPSSRASSAPKSGIFFFGGGAS